MPCWPSSAFSPPCPVGGARSIKPRRRPRKPPHRRTGLLHRRHHGSATCLPQADTVCSCTLAMASVHRTQWVLVSVMATVISPTDRRVIIEGVSWATYERLLADFGESHTARVAFDRGTLEIMAPSFAHERPANLLSQIVGILAEVHDLDLIGAGSTTFKREDVARGF